MIDISQFTTAVDDIQSINFQQARSICATLGLMLQEMMDRSSLNGVLNWDTGTGSDLTTLQTMRTTLTNLLNYVNDTSSHAPSDDYDRWDTLRSFWVQMCVEANALETATGQSFDNVANIPSDVAGSIESLPTTIGDAVGAVASPLGGFVSGAGVGLLLVIGAIAIYFVVKEGGIK